MTSDEFVVETLVIPLPMRVLDIFLHRVARVALTKRNDLRQAF